MPESAYMRGDREARLEDYLNDKLQTDADLHAIDTLLEDAKRQYSLLESQLVDARQSQQLAREAVEVQHTELSEKVQSFAKSQASIDRRLLILTQSETSDEALAKFHNTIQALQRVELAQGYMKLLHQVDSLVRLSQENISNNAQDALTPYFALKDISQALIDAQPAAENAAPHLVDHVASTCSALRQQLEDSFTNELKLTLEKMTWPSIHHSMNEETEERWADNVRNLLSLQEPDIRAREDRGLQKSDEPLVLLPLAIMCKPLALRFKYHFEGDRPTNKIDKPEYFLSHVNGLLNSYDDFFSRHLQPILTTWLQGSTLTMTSTNIDSTSALISAVLPMVREKLASLLPAISQRPPLFSHLIHELMAFDESLRQEWGYDGCNRETGWPGLCWELLTKQNWFNQWLSMEKDFALSRYHQIVDNRPDNFELDYDGVAMHESKPTKAAIQVNDLLETITDRYKPLQSFSQKVQFLIEIQISIFDMFHARLHDSLAAYQNLMSPLGRGLHGAPREMQIDMQGLTGLERLCRIYGSADFMERKLRDWGDDIFFIDLWDDLQDRARAATSRDPDGKMFAGPMSVTHVAERTSRRIAQDGSAEGDDVYQSTIARNSIDVEGDDIGGALFDETACAFRNLRLRSGDVMQERVMSSIRDALRSYTKLNTWAITPLLTRVNSSDTQAQAKPDIAWLPRQDSVDDTDESDTDSALLLTPTAELGGLLTYLSTTFGFLAQAIGRVTMRQLVRQAMLTVQSIVWDNVIQKHMFSHSGALQLRRDMELVVQTVQQAASADQQGIGLHTMHVMWEGLVLLGLPTGHQQGSTGLASQDAGKESLEDDINDDADEEEIVENGNNLTLWQVEARLFRNNEDARDVLHQLGLTDLGESSARSILSRRIELGR